MGRGRGMGRGPGQGRGMGRGRMAIGSASRPKAWRRQEPLDLSGETRLPRSKATGLIKTQLPEPEKGGAGVLAAVVDAKRCKGCGACADVCPTSSITVTEVATVNQSTCIACGSCVEICPGEAISLKEI